MNCLKRMHREAVHENNIWYICHNDGTFESLISKLGSTKDRDYLEIFPDKGKVEWLGII